MRHLLVRLGLPLALAAATIGIVLTTSSSRAAVSCPNAVPVVNENNCKGEGSSDWLTGNYDDNVAGFATQTSFNRGTNVPLKIARNATAGSTKVNIEVFRLGYYGNEGGRLVQTANNVTVNNNLTCKTAQPDPVTGEYSCANWAVTYTVPSSALTTSGVYIAKLTTVGGTALENTIPFIVRDDNPTVDSKILVVLPTADYAAYNSWGGKNLYYDRVGGGTVQASGTGRAVKVSFDRPMFDGNEDRDRIFGPESETIFWLEKQGYDVSYSDDVAVSQNPASLKDHDIVIVPGHSEYWSEEEFKGFKAAREAGVDIASFSANTAYWKVRYENGSRTLVCYKTVQGDGSNASGAISDNDWGPDGVKGTADDALGLDGIAGTADDKPQNSTTTFRDNGAPPGDPNAPPGGRVGPDMPENSLWGVMYFGDNPAQSYPLSIPAGNANEEFSSDRIWRNTGISENKTTTIGDELVGWEWDSVPTQAQYLAQQPAGVKKLTSTNTDALGGTANSWIIDEGRQRTNFPPAGLDGTVHAVKYKAASGAQVFASGTMRWSRGLESESDPRIEQATYNILSDMGAQPATPEGITLDPGGSNQVPNASFTLTPNPVGFNTTVTFNGSASKDTDGSIAKYEWDLDGNGTYEVSGTSSSTTRKYTSDATIDVRLRVTDNKGATDVSVKTLTVIGNQFPVPDFTATPNPVIQGLTVSLNGSVSKDPDGTIAKYEWDRDGNGTFETNTGTTSSTTFAYATPGTYQVKLRVTDNGGKQATKEIPVTVSVAGVSSYSDAVKDTPGLIHYWRLGETSGTTFADSVGGANATTKGGPTLGVPGGIAADPDLAARFDGVDDTAQAPLDLSGLNTITVEFWLYVDSYTNDDAMTLEHTANFNQNKGGFLIDPNAPQAGGKFGIGIGTPDTRNDAYFERPSAGQWHHYAIVLDSTAPAETEITPYVDGKAVAYTKAAKGTGSGSFANSTLNFMSRAGSGYFERGALDDVAIYDRALTAAQIAEHDASFGTNRRPVASFTATPSPVLTGVPVTLNGAGSTDPDGSIVKYEWDLDGNGTYETSTGSTASTTKTFSANGEYTLGLRVTDNLTGTDTTTRTIKVGPQAPTASFTADPNPAVIGGSIHFNASGSEDSDGTIAKYEWDLDGNGTYEADTGATAAADRVYTLAGTFEVGLRVIDNSGLTATAKLPVTVNGGGVSNYGDAVLETPGLVAYWRLGEASGPKFADSQGTATGTASAGAIFGQPGAVTGDPNKAIRFDGNNSAKAPLNLSATSKATVEFWLKWDSYADDDALALELTENFNANSGGFIVDPNAPQEGGKFGVGIGLGSTRNNVFFARPSAAQWHHYAFVFDTTAPAAQQITPYVDGQAVAYTKTASGTGAGNFANSILNFMSRNGEILKGAGTLDEVAIYNRALTQSEIAAHRASNGANQKPKAALSISPNPVSPGGHAVFDASGSTDTDGTLVKYEWDLDGNGTYETNTGSTPTASANYAKEGEYPISVKVYDDALAIDIATKTLKVGGVEPQPPVASYSAQPNPAVTDIPVHFDAAAAKDSDGSIVKYEWDLDGNGTYETDTGATASTDHTYSTVGTVQTHLRVTDNSGMTDSVVLPLTVNAGGVSNYGDTVLDTPGLVGYWRLGEATGPNLADSKGTATGSAVNGTVFGSPGALTGDPNAALGFDGTNDFGSVPVNLSGTSKATIEFWLNWSAYDNEDDLALELTQNFNQNNGGLIVDPNSSQGGFGVGIGIADSRNNVFFNRPSAGQWHHYALVLDSSAPPAQQITPYVDGQPVTYTKTATGTGAGNFANSTLYLMSRAGLGLFGKGSLDELAVYNRALTAAEIAEHDASYGLNRRPHAALTAAPNPAITGEQVSFDASGSSDPDGSIVKYQWDLDGNGTFETSTGTTPTASITTSHAGSATVSVRVLDNAFATDTETKTVTVNDPEAPPPPPSSYSAAVLATPGLLHYWRLNEAAGSTSLADSVGGATATTGGGATLGMLGSLGGSAAGFDGLDDFAQAAVDLSADSKITIEFWMRWNAFADNDALAMELTPNFNGNEGGVLIDPNAEQGNFGVGIGTPDTRNNAYFARPSAGVWHHYAFVLDTTAPVSQQVTPYVDGQPVTYEKGASGAGTGNFANSNLYFMSRAGANLFGGGGLDEVAIYDRALSPAQIAAHFATNTP
ncbi:MAG TPA: N,N-dimethylformamidase beta subunit family domain-containing protein [Solirubrobacterales bacterium]|nr:N,N-dimethylformamidase beta subunit family domain-containing protein [Solirubrobacterales bacterium]